MTPHVSKISAVQCLKLKCFLRRNFANKAVVMMRVW